MKKTFGNRSVSAPALDDSEQAVEGTRAAIVIVSTADFDVALLAKHLAQRSHGATSVALLSVNGTSSGTPIDYASTCARIWEYLGQCKGSPCEPRARADNKLWPNQAPNFAGACNLSAVLTEPITETGREVAKSPSVAEKNGAAHFGSDDRSSADLIPVMIASAREDLLKGLLPHLAGEQDIKVLGDPVVDPRLLSLCLEARQPGVLLLDKAIFDRLDPHELRKIHKRFPEVRVLLLWDEICRGLVEEILRRRFDGFLPTNCAPDAYVKAIRAVSRGELWLPRALLAKAISGLLHTPKRDNSVAENHRSHVADDSLTRREGQIVGLLRQGLTNKEIARQLGVMEDTVKKHLQSVFGKFGVRRRTLVLLRQVSGQLNYSHDAHDLPL
jgi:DNA-binding NarL/FixJ family response regulator